MITFKTYCEVTGHADFSVVKTTSPEKLKVIEWENKYFKQSVPSRKMYEQVLGVVGHGSQLLRHIKQYIDLGFREENIFICEIQEAAWRSLQVAAKRLESQGLIKNTNLASRIYHRDLIEVASELRYLTHIDFDETRSVTTLGEDVHTLYSVCPYLKTLCIVKTNRHNLGLTYLDEFEEFFIMLKERQGASEASKFARGVHMVLYINDNVEMVMNDVQQEMPHLSMLHNRYKYAPAMISFIFTTEGNWPEESHHSQQNIKYATNFLKTLKNIHTTIIQNSDYDMFQRFNKFINQLKEAITIIKKDVGELTPFQQAVEQGLAKYNTKSRFMKGSITN